MNAKKAFGLGTFFLVALSMAGGASLYIYRMELVGFARAPFMVGADTKVDVTIPKGAGPKQIATILADKGVVGDASLFYNYIRFVAKKSNALKAGDYSLSPSMSPEQIIALLEVGKPPELRFTIPEGLRKEEVALLIEQSGLAKKDDMLKAMNDPGTIAAFGVPKIGAAGQNGVPGGIEGYLFPDTYQFPKNTPPAKILARMRERLDEVVNADMRARMATLGWDLHRTLTLAAIVEKETGAPQERPHISSVFHNRMKLKMKLQTDPTVIYGIPDYKGNITRDDLLREHPYNTYTITGLPPGPIAQPGLAAINAALFPDDTKDLYFVSRNDGTHIFCPSLECHNAAVQKWQVEFFRQARKGK